MGDCQCKPPVDHRCRKGLHSHHHQCSHHHHSHHSHSLSHHLSARHHHPNIRTTQKTSSPVRDQVPLHHQQRIIVDCGRPCVSTSPLGSSTHPTVHPPSFTHRRFHPFLACSFDETNRTVDCVLKKLINIKSFSSSICLDVSSSTVSHSRRVEPSDCKCLLVVSVLLLICVVAQVVPVSAPLLSLSSSWHVNKTRETTKALVLLIVVISLSDYLKCNGANRAVSKRRIRFVTSCFSKSNTVTVTHIKVPAPFKKPTSSCLSTGQLFTFFHFLYALTTDYRRKSCISQHEIRKHLETTRSLTHVIEKTGAAQGTQTGGKQRDLRNQSSFLTKNETAFDNPSTIALCSSLAVLDKEVKPRAFRQRSLAEVVELSTLVKVHLVSDSEAYSVDKESSSRKIFSEVHCDSTPVPVTPGINSKVTHITSNISKRIQNRVCLAIRSSCNSLRTKTIFEKLLRIVCCRETLKPHKVDNCASGDWREGPMSQKLISRTIYMDISRKKPMDTDDNYLEWFKAYLNIAICLSNSLLNLSHHVLVSVISCTSVVAF